MLSIFSNTHTHIQLSASTHLYTHAHALPLKTCGSNTNLATCYQQTGWFDKSLVLYDRAVVRKQATGRCWLKSWLISKASVRRWGSMKRRLCCWSRPSRLQRIWATGRGRAFRDSNRDLPECKQRDSRPKTSPPKFSGKMTHSVPPRWGIQH